MWALTRALKTLEVEVPTVTALWSREGHVMRGRAPENARTLEDRFAELRARRAPRAPATDIGLPYPRPSRSKELSERLQHIKQLRNNKEIDKLARSHKLLVDLEEVEKDWLSLNGPHQIKTIAEHYGVFRDLYTEGFFVPRVPLQILFKYDEEYQSPVYHGNVIKPHEARDPPDVHYEATDDTLWTLVLTNLDGHLTKENCEYIHWCVANIPGNDVQRGETIVDYLQPIPPRGTGYHRYVFVLYKQEKRIDYNITKVSANDSLESRTFETRKWYQNYQDQITPGGLAFFQSDWDWSLKDFYHNVLNMKEPIYEYDFDPPYVRKQEWFPLRKPFNVYLDKYRDPKDVNKDYLLLKLSKEHPFKKPDPPSKYPNAHPFPRGVPSWINFQNKKIRNNWGRINEV